MGSIDDSLAAMPEPQRSAVQRVISIARRLVPDAEQGISYGVPALILREMPLIAIVPAAKHISVFPFSSAVVDGVAERLDGYSLSRGTIRFIPSHPLPEDVVEDVVRLRLAQILEKTGKQGTQESQGRWLDENQ